MATENSDFKAPFYSALNLWTLEQCAQALQMAPGTLKNMGKNGPPRLKLGGRVFYKPSHVDAWLDSYAK